MKKRIAVWMIWSWIFLCLAGCSNNSEIGNKGTENGENKETAEIFAMDTIMELTVYAENSSEVLSEARQMVQNYENLFSVNIGTSDVARLNKAAGEPVQVSEETYDLIQKSIGVSKLTEGLFDISVYPLVKAWGFTTETYRVPEQEEIQRILENVDYSNIKLGENNTVTLGKDMQIDLGGIAKGYVSQKLTDFFREKQVDAAIVSLGGNVQTCGTKPDGTPFIVGITNPEDGIGVLGTIEIGEKAVITSGSYQRYFEKDGIRYHHIMDKRTGAPAKSDLTSVTVIADNGESADSLATALFVMGKEEAIKFAEENTEIQLILVDTDYNIWTSEGITLNQMENGENEGTKK